MFSVAWMEVMLLSTAFAYSRGRCCAVANLEVSLRTFTYTAAAQEKKFVFISYKCNGHFKSVFVLRGCGGRVKKGVGKKTGGRERCFLWGLFYWPVCGWEPETGPLLCRTALWDCFKDINTSFIGSLFHFRESKTAQKSVPYDTTPIS